MLLMTPPKKRGRPKGTAGPKKVTLHLEIPVELKAALVALARRNDRKITAEAIRALQAHCGNPPPQAGAEPDDA